MAPTLYMTRRSCPVRAVLMTSKAIGLTLQEKIVDSAKGEHLKPEFLKLNPQHTVPVLVDDDGFTIWDSHAINIYLISKYAKNDSLYPKELKKRAIVDQRLHFDSGVAFTTLRRIVSDLSSQRKSKIEDFDRENVKSVYSFVEVFLEGKQWIAGDSLTIADYSLYCTITALNVLVPFGQNYPKLIKWIENVNNLPEAEPSKKGLGVFESTFKMYAQSN